VGTLLDAEQHVGCNGLRCPAAAGTCSVSEGLALCGARPPFTPRDGGSVVDGSGREVPLHLALPERPSPLRSHGVLEGAVGGASAVRTRVATFEARAGHWYHLAVSCGAGPGSQPFCRGAFTDAEGRLLGPTAATLLMFGTSRAGRTVLRAERTGPVHLVLVLPASSGVLRYSARLEDWGDDLDPEGDTPATAADLPAAPALEQRSFSGRVDFEEDVDVFRLPEVPAGGGLELSCTSGNARPLTFRVAGAGEGSHNGATVVHTGLPAGRPLVEVRLMQGTFFEPRSPQAVPYACTFRLLPPDVGADAATAAPLAAPGEARGWFSGYDDEDSFRVPLVGGRYYRARCTTQASCWLRLRAPSGDLHPTDPTPEGAVFKAAAGGEHLLTAHGYGTGAYTLSVEDLGADDHADAAAGATLLTLEGPAVVAVREVPSDQDALAFDAAPREEGEVLRVTCALGGEGLDSFDWLRLELRDAAGALVDLASGRPGSALWVSVAPPGPGRYVARLWDSVGARFRVPPSASCRLVSLGRDDHPDTPSGAAPPSPLPLQVSGRRETRADRDVVAFTATAGALVSVRGPTGPASLTDAQGVPLASLWAPLADGLGFRAPATGTYLLHVERAQWGEPTTDWSASIEDLGPDDHGDTVQAATALAPGTSVAGWAQSGGDEDVFTAPLAARGVYRLTATPAAGETGPLSLSAWGQSGNLSVTTWEAEGDPRTQAVHVREDGQLGIFVRGLSRYTVHLEEVARDDHADTEAQATPLPLATDTRGVFESRVDADVFRFVLEPGRHYRATGRNLPGSLMPWGLRDLQYDWQGGFSSASGGAATFTVHAGWSVSPGTEYWLRVDRAD
jgi:hypothetical protein